MAGRHPSTVPFRYNDAGARGRQRRKSQRGDRPPRAFEVPENTRDQQEKDSGGAMSTVPKPVFSHSHNGRTRNVPRPGNHGYMNTQHEEAAKFLSDSWDRTMKEYRNYAGKEGGPEWYRQREANPEMESFKKFDLEEHWGTRTIRRLTESS